jgi:predicted nicotinamide N-methyase
MSRHHQQNSIDPQESFGVEPGQLQSCMQDPAGLRDFIRANLPLVPVLAIPAIKLHQAGPESGLRRLDSSGRHEAVSPYWAYCWGGGLALARHFLERPEVVAGRRVLDLGSGSGLVAIAAAMAGAGAVTAADIDHSAATALKLNAEANGVAVSVVVGDLTTGPSPAVDLVAVGDLFYERKLALRVTAFLDRCLASGIEILIGDPGRQFLPVSRLSTIAAYAVSGFGDVKQPPWRQSFVFRYQRDVR